MKTFLVIFLFLLSLSFNVAMLASQTVFAMASSADITSRINNLGLLLDIDGNSRIDPLSDGLLILRYLFGIRGTTLINGVIATDATRTTASEIESYLAKMTPNL